MNVLLTNLTRCTVVQVIKGYCRIDTINSGHSESVHTCSIITLTIISSAFIYVSFQAYFRVTIKITNVYFFNKVIYSQVIIKEEGQLLIDNYSLILTKYAVVLYLKAPNLAQRSRVVEIYLLNFDKETLIPSSALQMCV